MQQKWLNGQSFPLFFDTFCKKRNFPWLSDVQTKRTHNLNVIFIWLAVSWKSRSRPYLLLSEMYLIYFDAVHWSLSDF